MAVPAAIVGNESRLLATEPPVHILTLRTDGPFAFKAGQYLEVVHPDGTAIPLSIASIPEQLPLLTLHYRSTPGLVEAERMNELLEQGTLSIQGGSGNVYLNPEDDSALLLVAGGTGISQALCLALAQRSRQPRVDVRLLACADSEADLYFRDLLPPAIIAQLIADSNRDRGNRGLQWLASEGAAYLQTFEQTGKRVRVILSGSPAFVYAATDCLTGAGIPAEALESDVYAWAPR